jgi:regulator of protease activity HflC (stomatin/prohibitin superfamily)
MSQTSQPRPVRRPIDEQGRWVLIILMVLMFFSFWFLAHRLERLYLTELNFLVTTFPLLPTMPRPFISIIELLHPRVLRHFLPLAVGVYLAYRAAVGMIKTLYDLPEDDDATKFLGRLRAASPAGVKAAVLKSDTLAADRAKSVVLRVGGPANVMVAVGNVVVTELNGRFRRVLDAGMHTLERFETVHSILDLRPQERTVTDVLLLTRDGLEITADLTVSFRIQREGEPSVETPFPFAAEAVCKAAYYARVHPEHVDIWQAVPLNEAKSALYAIIAQLNLDDILDPDTPGTDPEHTIQKRLKAELETRLKLIGLELVAVHVNHLVLPQPVVDQVIDYWQTRWEGERSLITAEGEAEALEAIDLARTEAEIGMIQAIAQGIKLAREQSSTGNMRDVLALRLIEALERMALHSQEAGPLTEPLTQEILPRLTDMRRRVNPPYLNERTDDSQS